ncbi:hypothetical protein FSP39_024511 [Pinctada imbricata]|uniref:Reverse transcriptase domain-containing protein n=1 Tax=Pinctada imbricata TaxID=66713 RepID=A0AA88XGS4_PINIB|nr:hypothetical protein FSP39_024511 [Pinctada imbricata]
MYTTLPHDKINDQLSKLIKWCYNREGKIYICTSESKGFFSATEYKSYKSWSCSDLCSALSFLLDNIYVRFGENLYKQVVGIPMGTNCAPLVADLFLYTYEKEFIQNLQKQRKHDDVKCFTGTSRYLDDILTIDNPVFEKYKDVIYPQELTLNKANFTDTETPFLDLNIKIVNGEIHTSVYDKRDDFGFNIVNFPWLDGDVPRLPSYGIYISQLIRRLHAIVNLKLHLLSVGQDTESTTETVTYPFPDVPGAPAGMPLPTEVDAFSDVPLDTPLESLPNEVVNDIVSDIDPLPNNPINENAEEKEATDTAIIGTTTTSLITSSGTPETTVPTVQANITTVAANFDPSFLADNSNKNDLMLISEPSDTQPMSDKSFTDVDGKNRTTSDMTLEETYEGNFTEIEIFPVNQTKNYTTFSADTVIDGQDSFSRNTTPVYVGTDPSSADSTIAGETTTIGTPTNTVYETTTIVPQIDIQSTTPVQSEDAATQSVTVVNEANIEDYLITRPRIGTSVDTITVDVGNINKYVTTRQKQPTKPSFIDTADSMPDLVGPPPPPPYDILNADANQGQGAGDQLTI